MTKYLAGVLTVIAVGVLLIAYGLLNPGAEVGAASALAPITGQMPTGQMPIGELAVRSAAGHAGYVLAPAGGYLYPQSGYVQPAYAPAVYSSPTYAQPVAMTAPEPRAVRTVSYEPTVSRRTTAPRRNWKRTALIIGGASAAGAGVGAMVGGGKGALIGAAIGGGASTIYQTVK